MRLSEIFDFKNILNVSREWLSVVLKNSGVEIFSEF